MSNMTYFIKLHTYSSDASKLSFLGSQRSKNRIFVAKRLLIDLQLSIAKTAVKHGFFEYKKL